VDVGSGVAVGVAMVGVVLIAVVEVVLIAPAVVAPRSPLLRILAARLPIPPTRVTSTPLLATEVGLVLIAPVTAGVVVTAVVVVLVILLVLIVCGLY
jgi:hypothetical protein